MPGGSWPLSQGGWPQIAGSGHSWPSVAASWPYGGPLSDPSTLAWFDAGMGRTDVKAAVVSPNDVSNVAWSQNLTSAPNAQTILATAGAGNHYAYQVAGLRAGYAATYYAEVKQGTNRYVCFTDALTPVGIFDLQAGSPVLQTSCAVTSGPQMGDGFWPITVKAPTLGQAYIAVGPSTAASYSYTAAGTETVLVRNASVTQVATNAWADQTGRNGAAVTAPSNFAAWSQSNLGTVTATAITDNSTAGVQHYVSCQIPGINVGRSARCSVRILPTTTRYACVSCNGNAADSYIMVDMQTHTLPAYGTNISNPVLAQNASGDWILTWSFSVTVGGSFYFFTANGPAYANTNYTGSGAITAAADQWFAFQSIALTQSTAANCPALLYDQFGRAYLWGDGVNDALQGAIAGLAQPITVVGVGYWGNAYAAQAYLWDAKSNAQMGFTRQLDTQMMVYAGTALTGNVSAGDARNIHTWGATYNGATSAIYRDGVALATGNAGAAAVDGLTVFSSGAAGSPSNAYLYAIGVFSGAKDAAWHARFRQFAQRQYGAP